MRDHLPPWQVGSEGPGPSWHLQPAETAARAQLWVPIHTRYRTAPPGGQGLTEEAGVRACSVGALLVHLSPHSWTQGLVFTLVAQSPGSGKTKTPQLIFLPHPLFT